MGGFNSTLTIYQDGSCVYVSKSFYVFTEVVHGHGIDFTHDKKHSRINVLDGHTVIPTRHIIHTDEAKTVERFVNEVA
jgi:predicted DCC family thiol-disulfide oxidoreductase YuxK